MFEQEWTLILGKECRIGLPFHRVELREGGIHEDAFTDFIGAYTVDPYSL